MSSDASRLLSEVAGSAAAADVLQVRLSSMPCAIPEWACEPTEDGVYGAEPERSQYMGERERGGQEIEETNHSKRPARCCRDWCVSLR